MQRSNLLGLLAGTALAVLLAGCGTAEHTAAEPEPSMPLISCIGSFSTVCTADSGVDGSGSAAATKPRAQTTPGLKSTTIRSTAMKRWGLSAIRSTVCCR